MRLSCHRGPAAAVLAVTVSLLLTVPAGAQQSSPTITANGMGTAKPDPIDRNSERSIEKAVERAQQAALPKAVTAARERAQQFAQAAGLTLGPLISLAEPTPSPFGPFGGYASGTFGPGRYCGIIRGVRVTRDAKGRVHRKRIRPHRVCRVPSQIQAAVSATYATTS